MTATNNSSKRKLRKLRILTLLGVTVGVFWVLGGRRPEQLGVQDGKLLPCPASPNCVSTQATDDIHSIQPLPFSADLAAIRQSVLTAIQALPRTKIITETDDYFHVECRSLLLRFVDDLEIWIDSENQLVHARSASRVGYSDLGVNRQRVETLFANIRE